MRATQSRCASCLRCVAGRRRGAAIDDKAWAAILVTRLVRGEFETVRAVPYPVPLLTRAMTMPRIPSLCTGTQSSASPRCCQVTVDEIHRPGCEAGLAGGGYQRWLYGSFGLSCLDWSSFQLCLRLGAIVGDVLHRAVVRRRDGGDVLGARPLVAPSVIRLYGFV